MITLAPAFALRPLLSLSISSWLTVCEVTYEKSKRMPLNFMECYKNSPTSLSSVCMYFRSCLHHFDYLFFCNFIERNIALHLLFCMCVVCVPYFFVYKLDWCSWKSCDSIDGSRLPNARWQWQCGAWICGHGYVLWMWLAPMRCMLRYAKTTQLVRSKSDCRLPEWKK